MVEVFNFKKIRPTLPKTTREIGWNLLFIVLYFLAGKFGLFFASFNPSVSVIWPPTGIAIATIILFGYKFWPGILIGAFLTNITTGGAVFASGIIAIGNTLEAVSAGYAINVWAHGKYVFDKLRSTLIFTMFVAIACSLASTIGVSTLILSGLAQAHDVYALWFTWWLGDMGGAFILTPLIILWISSHRHILSRYQVPELIAAIFFLALTGEIVFNGIIHSLPINYPLPFIIVPPLIWLALRFKRRIVTIAMFMISVIAIQGTLEGFGPFGSLNPNQSLLVLQTFLVITVITVLLIISLVAERAQSYKALAIKERHFRALIEKNPSGIVLLDDRGNITYMSSAVEHIVGYSSRELIGTSGTNFLYAPITDDDSDAVSYNAQAEHFADFVAKKESELPLTEIHFRRNDGTWIWLESVSTNLLSDPDINAIVVNFHDITERKQLREKKNQFLSIVSRELRIPLETIRKYAATLLENKKQRTALEQTYIQEIDRSSIDMTKHVDNLLKIFRLETGILDIRPRVTKLRKEVEEALHRVNNKITAKKITLEKHFILQGTTVHVDSLIFTSIVSTLLTEIIKHTPENGKLIVEIIERNKHPSIFIHSSKKGSDIITLDNPDLLVAKALAAYIGVTIVQKTESDEQSLLIVMPLPDHHTL